MVGRDNGSQTAARVALGALLAFLALGALFASSSDRWALFASSSGRTTTPPPARGVTDQVGAPVQAGGADGDGLYLIRNGSYHYAVCNGFTNQMLCHAGHIAMAIKKNISVVIPDAFITDGTQTTPEGSVLKNTMPTMENSVPLGLVFDTEALINRVRQLGGSARIGTASSPTPPVCSFLDVLRQASPQVVVKVLKALVPAPQMTQLLDRVLPALFEHVASLSSSGTGEGVCFHHRDGLDWHRHCDQWEGLSPYNHNCRNWRPISELIEHRTSHLRDKGRWLFYAGDHAVPHELMTGVMPVVTRDEIIASADIVASLLGEGSRHRPLPRDLGAAVDYFVCNGLPHFVGNSVSTWSAAQISRRDSVASWYNSRFIPLADFLKAYVVPVVYTYTEESSRLGKLMLQISLASTLRKVPHGTVHILYHGKKDTEFREWLTTRGITLHNHVPAWRGAVERLRKAGTKDNPFELHRFLSSGNYLGTWQRLDVPLHISAEYCFVLDSDAFVFRMPTFKDLGGGITGTLAFSTYLDENVPDRSDAGVVLMNVPFMRETLPDFQKFIFNRSRPVFQKGLGHHGAYLDFYDQKVTYLDQLFSMKAVYKSEKLWRGAFIVHFHGMKPHEWLRFWLTGTCEPAKCFLLFQFAHYTPYLCGAIQGWARGAAHENPGLLEAYCEEALPRHADLCKDLFNLLVATKGVARACQKKLKQAIVSRGLNLSDYEGRVK